MAIDEIRDRRWRIEALEGEPGWRTLVYHPGSPFHEAAAPVETDRRALMEEVETPVDRNQPS